MLTRSFVARSLRLGCFLSALALGAACSSPAPDDDVGGGGGGEAPGSDEGGSDLFDDTSIGKTTGKGAIDGLVGGQPITVVDALSEEAHDKLGGWAMIALLNDTGVCERRADREIHAGEVVLGIELWTKLESSAATVEPTKPGTFVVGAPEGSRAVAFIYRVDLACSESMVFATEGSVTLTKVGDRVYAGSGTLTFPDSDPITFTFDTGLCETIAIGSDYLTCK